MDLSLVQYEDTRPTAAAAGNGRGTGAVCGGGGGPYLECMRNHAAAIGGQAFDGCGEFMPGGSPSTMEALLCAACGCHRNFHRRAAVTPFLLSPVGRWPGFLAPPPVAVAQARAGSETPPLAGEEEARRRKRCRTRFTAEQKEKMQAFAEKLGWRINKQDDGAMSEFCGEVGIERSVLKVWIHNNKSSHAKRESGAAASPTASGATPITV